MPEKNGRHSATNAEANCATTTKNYPDGALSG
jgi:hypothetical protein